MKKAILYSFLVSALFFSCSKEKKQTAPPANSLTKYNVKFSVSGFTSKILGSLRGKTTNGLRTLAANDTSNSDSISVLYYVVCSSTSGAAIEQRRLLADSVGFNTISDNLPAGSYTFYFVGGQSLLSFHATNPRNYFYYNSQAQGPYMPWYDTFESSVTMTVSGNVSNQNITMNRIVGQLEVNITDSLPATAKTFTITVTNDKAEYVVAYNTAPFYEVQMVDKFTDTVTADVGKTYQKYMLLGDVNTPMTIDLACYDQSNSLIGHAVVDGVRCYPNTRTILSGNLFGAATAGDGFTISLNDGWVSNPNLTVHF